MSGRTRVTLLIASALLAAVTITVLILPRSARNVDPRMIPQVQQPLNARYQVWFSGDKTATWQGPLPDDVAKGIYDRDGAKTSAGFVALEDERWSRKELGKVVFRIKDRRYEYPFYEATNDVMGTRYIWWGPQNDMRLQTETRDQFLLAVGDCLGSKTSRPPAMADALPPEKWTKYQAP